MAIQPPQRFELDDLAHVEREARTIYAPGASPGDVLVVQSDHSLVAAPGGGSSPVEGFSLPIAFDTPGLTTTGLDTGITLAVGDMIMHVALGCTVVWNGDGPPAGYWYIDGQNPYTQSLVGGQLDSTNTDNNGSGTTNPIQDNQSALVVALAGQLMFKVVNNADGSEDNSTAGVGLLSALVIHV